VVLGGCPAGQTCEETISINSNGLFVHTCKCVGPEACCLPNADITCQDILPDTCLSFGGFPQGPGTVCLGHDACCLPDGSCQFVDAVCCDDLGGDTQGPGSMCQGTGTCCADITDDLCIYDTCAEQDGICCAANGGVFQGVGTACEIQACCIDSLCCMLDEDCCVISGGVAAGAGTACTGDQGACCYDGDGDSIAEVCIVTDATCCADLGGLYHGPGSTCSPNYGACCLGMFGGMCIEMNETCCTNRFLGNGTACLGDSDGDRLDDACFPPDQACCLGAVYSNACIFVVPPACASKGGVPQGIGTDCSAREACCLPSGRCLDRDPLCCDELGGMTRGPGSFCRPYGDIYPKPGDGVVEIGDVLKVLDAYADINPCLNYPNAELVYDTGCPRNCASAADCVGLLPAACTNLNECCDGVDLSEVLAILDLYAGIVSCPDGACR